MCVCVCVFQTNASKRVHPAGKVLDTVNQIISPISAIQLALDHLRVMIRLPGQNPVKGLDGGGGRRKKTTKTFAPEEPHGRFRRHGGRL